MSAGSSVAEVRPDSLLGSFLERLVVYPWLAGQVASSPVVVAVASRPRNLVGGEVIVLRGEDEYFAIGGVSLLPELVAGVEDGVSPLNDGWFPHGTCVVVVEPGTDDLQDLADYLPAFDARPEERGGPDEHRD